MARSLKDRVVALNFTSFMVAMSSSPFIYVGVAVYLYHTSYWFFPFLYALWYLYDFGSAERGGRKWLWYKVTWNIACYKHFPVKIVKTRDLSPEKNHILGCHPHGQFLLGSMGAFAFDAADFGTMFPGVRPLLFIHYALFHIPLIRALFLASGMLAASRKGLEHVLRGSSKGVACAFSIGGAKEAVEEWTSHLALILKSRKGFVKMAIRHGADLVPTFTFGENLTYSQVKLPRDSALGRLQQWLLSKSINVAFLLHGRSVLIGERGLAPYRVPLTVVVGAPIHVVHNENPSQEEVDLIHGQYVQALKTLYEEYNPVYGNPAVPLVIN